MKKRFILASSLAIVLSVGAFLGLAFNQRAGQLRAARVDAATATTQNLFQQDTQGAHLPGNAVYFIPESSVSWWTSNADTRMYFQNDDNSYGAFSDVMTYVFNRNSNADKPVYQVTVPAFPNGSGLTAWTKFQAVRCLTGQVPSSISDTAVITDYSGSCDIYFSESYHNTIGYYEYQSAKKNYCDNINAYERLEVLSWVEEWSKPGFYSSCDSTGATQPAELKTHWDNTGSLFGALGADVKYVFSHQAAVPGADDNKVASVGDFVARYDLVYSKYATVASLSNWGDRTIG